MPDLWNRPLRSFRHTGLGVVIASLMAMAASAVLAQGPPDLEIEDVSVLEGDGGTTMAVFRVTLSVASAAASSVNFAVVNGTATAPEDFVAATGTVLFQPGTTTQTIQVVVNGDTVAEHNETFFINLTRAVNATIVRSQGVGSILNDDGVTISAIAADAATLGPIPDAAAGACGAPRDVTFTVPALVGTLQGVTLTTSLTHSFVGDLWVDLFGPGGQVVHTLFARTGKTGVFGVGDSSNLVGPYTFRDWSAGDWWAAAAAVGGGEPIPAGSYRPSEPGDEGATGRATTMNGSFEGEPVSGTWTLRFQDCFGGDVGMVTAASLGLMMLVLPTSTDDAYTTPFGSALIVAAPGVLGNDASNGGAMTAQLVTAPASGSVALNPNGGFVYTPAAGVAGVVSFTYRALNAVGPGNVATVTITIEPGRPTTVADSYATTYPTPLIIPAPGVLGNDLSNGGGALSAQLVQTTAHGVLSLGPTGSVGYTPNFGFAGTDSFTYRAVSGVGPGDVATVTITVNPPTTVQAPYDLRVDSVVGNLVTLRFDTLSIGPQATTFVLEGGLNPGQVLASIPTLSAYPIFTFVAPAGSFFIRMHGQAGADKSPASNEVPLHVGVPAPPSAPTNLLALVNGSTLALTWKQTFGGGPPSGLVLDVTGSLTTSMALGLGESLAFSGVPAGTYSLSLRAANSGGTSPPSAPLTLTFPGGCSGPPGTPARFLAYHTGGTAHVIWDPPTAGPAPTGYVLDVTGSAVASIPTTARTMHGSVGPGTYDLRVVATNACGVSAPTPVRSLVVP